MSEKVVVSYRQMHGSAPERRTFHRPSCGLFKNRPTSTLRPDITLSREAAVAAGYRACERCSP